MADALTAGERPAKLAASRQISSNTPAVGLCATCVNMKPIRSDRGSLFYRCLLSDKNPAFPKYPRLPVLRCVGWQSIEPDKRV
jgi:hypothetical protein